MTITTYADSPDIQETYWRDGFEYTVIDGIEYVILKPDESRIVTDEDTLAMLNGGRSVEEESQFTNINPETEWLSYTTEDISNNVIYYGTCDLRNQDMYYSPKFIVNLNDSGASGVTVYIGYVWPTDVTFSFFYKSLGVWYENPTMTHTFNILNQRFGFANNSASSLYTECCLIVHKEGTDEDYITYQLSQNGFQ